MIARVRLLTVLLADCLILAGAAAPALANSPSDLFYERSLVSAAGVRCKLFEPSVASALVAAGNQARGAALRAGVDALAIEAAGARARARAASLPCGSSDLATVAARVKKGFEGYSAIKTMTFPGDAAAWRADRGLDKRFPGDWRLSQTARGPSGQVVFGIASIPGGDALTAVAVWPGALAASGARLVLRDPSKAPRAYIDPRRTDLAGRSPPRSVTRSFLAGARAPAGAALLPAGSATGAAFRFPVAAAIALESLDPREAVLFELVYPTRDGERVESIPLEVGDFAAGRAFLSARR